MRIIIIIIFIIIFTINIEARHEDNLQCQIDTCSNYVGDKVDYKNGKISFSFRFIAMACSDISFSAKRIKDTVYIISSLENECKKHKKPYRICGKVEVPEKEKYRVVFVPETPYTNYTKSRKSFDGVIYNQSILIKDNKNNHAEEVSAKQASDSLAFRSHKSIMKVLHVGKKDLMNIYKVFYDKDSTFQGTLNVEFTIHYSGKVLNAKVRNNCDHGVYDEAFKQFIIQKIKEWEFGEISNQNDTDTVIYPFYFSYDNMQEYLLNVNH